MQKLQESVFSIVKTTNLSPAVFNFLQPSDYTTDKTPLGGILNDTRHGWLALGPKFCVVDLRTGLKVAAKIFGTPYSNSRATITGVVELPVPLTDNSKQLIVSLSEDLSSTIYVFHINGSQVLRCIQTDLIVTQLVVCDGLPDGPFTCFDGVVMAGTKSGEIFVFDLNRAGLIQAIKDISQGYEHLIQNESNPANLTFLPMNALEHFEEQRDLALENNDHLAILMNDNSLLDDQYLFRNPDSSIRMKAKRDHIRVTVMQYIPQLGSLIVGYNFGAFQIWNLLTLELEYTSQVNVECIPVTHFGFQEPCDDPRAFCYLWVVYSAIDRFEDEQFPLAVMYSLTYHGKRMLSDTKCLYQEFSMASTRFQVELGAMADPDQLSGGKCVSCHTYSINSTLGSEGEDSMLNICQLVWECWGDNPNYPSQYGMVLFDLDQWYKDQMPETYRLQSNAFMSATWCSELSGACALDARLEPSSVAPYSHTTRLEEHFYPNSLQYRCICLTTSEACVLSTVGIQRQIINSLDDAGPTALLNPPRLYHACLAAGLSPLYTYHYNRSPSQEDQRRFLLSVALEARLSRFLKRCAHDWATGTHVGAGCTLTFLVDWCWKRAIELKENAKELTAPLFSSSALPDRNVVRCLEHCVQQLTQLTGLLDAVLTKCCNLVVPDALSEIEEKYKGIGTVSLYFQVVQWFLRVGLLPERHEAYDAVPYPAHQLYATYNKRRMKLQRLEENSPVEEKPSKSCSLLYIDQLIENEFGGEAIHQMWIKGGSECNGLYPPPSLYSLLRLYLLPGVAEEHKHSLVLYLLVDYSVVYDQVRYEAVIRRLMQFPTMFGLSNTAIKATQAFWHLDHRDFDFALDQLQCLTGNTLSEWQHNVVLSSLLAQKKTQAALQYLHVRKPAPIQARDALNSSRVDTDKLEDWQSCCNLYLARGLVYEALDVIRMCVQNAGCLADKIQVLNFFFKGCRNSGHLSKILQVSLLPLEEEVFIKYLQNCNEAQTSDILVVYYLQQTRYIEAEQYNSKLKMNKTRSKDPTGSVESLAEILDRENARDTAVELACASLPGVTSSVRDFVLSDKDIEPHVIVPKPMSVYIQATSPKNIFTYKSSFIQDTIENASETWMNKPKTRRGLKRALNIEEVPFICTPKLNKNRSFLGDQQSESTPAKRLKMDFHATPKTPKMDSSVKLGEKLSKQMATLLDMPEVQSPECKLYIERSGAGTPHSILKIRRNELDREAPSPVDSRYLGDSDDDMLETASNHTHYSDSTNKHLRFTIPTASESGSTPSPITTSAAPTDEHKDTMKEGEVSMAKEGEDDRHITTETHAIDESHPLESPPKKLATEVNIQTRKSYKDSVRARRSLSISANSSLSDDPNTSIESIADIPITLINPRYSGEKIRAERKRHDSIELHEAEEEISQKSEVPKTPKGRRGIRAGSESTSLNRSRSGTPERLDSPITPLHTSRNTRSRSRTPEISPRSSPLEPIIEQKQEETEIEHSKVTLDVPRRLRSKSRTPERMNKIVTDSPKLEAITESPTKSSTESSSPSRRSIRSRSRTPEVEIKPEETRPASPRSLRSRAKTPEKIMTPKPEHSTRSKKSLSRLVLEANTFAKTKLNLEHNEPEQATSESTIECTPMKALKQVPSLMDVTLSPIVHKSVLQSSSDSVMSETVDKDTTKPEDKSIADLGLQPLPAFTTIHETYFEKSVLRSYDSSIADTSESMQEDETKGDETAPADDLKSLPAFTTINEPGMKSVLHSYESSVAETSESFTEEGVGTKVTEIVTKTFTEIIETNIDKSVLKSYNSSVAESSQDNTNKDVNMSLIANDSDVEMKDDKAWNKIDSQDTASVIQKEKEKIVDIEREINELEGDMTDDDESDEAESSSGDEEIVEPDSNKSTDGSSTESDPTASESDEEIISINDTDSDESSSSEDKLEIVEGDSNDTNKQIPAAESALNEREKISDNNEEEEQKDPLDIVQEQATVNDPLAPTQSEREIATDATNEITGQMEPSKQAQLSMLTDDSSILDSEHSNVNLNYSDENIPRENKENTDSPMDTEPVVTVVIAVEEVKTASEADTVTAVAKDVDVIDSFANTDKANIAEEKQKPSTVEKEHKVDETKDKEKETEAESISKKDTEIQTTEESSKPAQKSRKRVKSTSSNKSTTENKTEDIDEPKTPSTRKRTQSNASNKTLESEQKTPEPENTPRRRVKTPTSTEVRKIMTRRASKEIAEKLDESKEALDEVVTPKRRSTRARSKADDNESVASESSVKSNRSRVSEDAGDVKTPVRKGRKSIMATKPDLSVIPEMIVEEDSKGTDDIINEYSRSRRLTRHQKAVLESWLEPSSPSRPRSRPASRARRASQDVASVASDASRDDEDDAKSAFEVQAIDRISLLNKQDFEGSPDPDELRNASPESIASDASKQRRSRLGRAASESKVLPKAAKVFRRVSVDVAPESPVGSPVPGTSPARGRRASFNKACEALHTPKGGRASTDTRKDAESPSESPAPSEASATPARRTRRTASTQSNTSQAKSDTGKRSKKTSTLDESKDKD